MGDRGNIVMRYNSKSRKTDIYFYTHNSGSEIGAIARRALAKRLRWDDDAYLGRIVFGELTRDAYSEETGFGVGPMPCDNSHDYLVIDCDNQKVLRCAHDVTSNKMGKILKQWSFDEFVDPANRREIDAWDDDPVPVSV